MLQADLNILKRVGLSPDTSKSNIKITPGGAQAGTDIKTKPKDGKEFYIWRLQQRASGLPKGVEYLIRTSFNGQIKSGKTQNLESYLKAELGIK